MRAFIEGWRFPVVAVTLLVSAVLLMAVTFVIPPSAGTAYEFAEEFKRWCFGYDAAAGTLEWAYLWMYLGQPLLLGGLILVVWRAPVREAWRAGRGRIVRWSVATLCLTTLAGFAMPALLPSGTSEQSAAFPGEAIRTTLKAAPFDLVNQESEPVRLADLRDRVVVVTAVYASCHDACPQIITQIKNSLSELTPREREAVTVVAITLDPVKDTPSMLAMMADLHDIDAPAFNLVTGAPDDVEAILDRYGFSRRRESPTAVIDHANLLHVIDRQGRIAFRLSLGPIQQAWLTEALRLLVPESTT